MVHSKLVCKEIAMTVETGVGNFFFDFPSISVDHWNEGCFAFGHVFLDLNYCIFCCVGGLPADFLVQILPQVV